MDARKRKKAMSDAAFDSSPVWIFFEQDFSDDRHVKCTECNKVSFVSTNF
jgi:hypothetical protein